MILQVLTFIEFGQTPTNYRPRGALGDIQVTVTEV